MKAIRLEAHGGPEHLKLHDVPEPIPGPDEALVQVSAAVSTSWISGCGRANYGAT